MHHPKEQIEGVVASCCGRQIWGHDVKIVGLTKIPVGPTGDSSEFRPSYGSITDHHHLFLQGLVMRRPRGSLLEAP